MTFVARGIVGVMRIICLIKKSECIGDNRERRFARRRYSGLRRV